MDNAPLTKNTTRALTSEKHAVDHSQLASSVKSSPSSSKSYTKEKTTTTQLASSTKRTVSSIERSPTATSPQTSRISMQSSLLGLMKELDHFSYSLTVSQTNEIKQIGDEHSKLLVEKKKHMLLSKATENKASGLHHLSDMLNSTVNFLHKEILGKGKSRMDTLLTPSISTNLSDVDSTSAVLNAACSAVAFLTAINAPVNQMNMEQITTIILERSKGFASSVAEITKSLSNAEKEAYEADHQTVKEKSDRASHRLDQAGKNFESITQLYDVKLITDILKMYSQTNAKAVRKI